MGTRGPVPKRSEQRVRRNKEDVPVEKVSAIGTVVPPDLDLGSDWPLHPLVQSLYESLKDSAQSRYYEPSDWQLARFALHFANQLLWSPKPSAQLLAEVTGMLSDLLVSEGDRRRVRLEIERGADKPDAEVIPISDVYRERLAKQG